MKEREKKQKDQNKYLIPYKIKEDEKPHETRSEYVEKALIIVNKNYSKIFERRKKSGGRKINFVEEIKRFEKSLLTSKVNADSNSLIGKTLPITRDWLILSEHPDLILRSEYLLEILGPMIDLDSIWPYIDRLVTLSCDTASYYCDNIILSPGRAVAIHGINFGDIEGSVFLETSENEVIELEIAYWFPNKICAVLHPDFEGFHPFLGKLWVNVPFSSSYRQSNSFNVYFRPIYEIQWIACYKIMDYAETIYSGNEHDYYYDVNEEGVILEDERIPDESFFIDHTESDHFGCGFSELRFPMAGHHIPGYLGRRYNQGYKLDISTGLDITEYPGGMYILYYLSGPRGVTNPPDLPGSEYIWTGLYDMRGKGWIWNKQWYKIGTEPDLED